MRSETSAAEIRSKSSVVLVTPELAQRLLASSDSQRPIRLAHVARLADAMRLGKWIDNGDTLSIDRNGMLRDGRHRCSAVIKAQTPIYFRVVYDVDPSTVGEATVLRWTLADILAARGESNCTALAACVSRVTLLASGGAKTHDYSTSVDVMLDSFLASPEEYRVAVRKAHARYGSWLGVPESVISSLWVLFSRASGEAAADEFFFLLSTGAGLSNGNPILALRSALVRAATGKVFKPKPTVVFAWIIKAWNAWIAGRELKLVKWDQGREPFPPVANLTT